MATVPIMGTTSARFQKHCRVEKRAFKPFAATGELQPSESKTATFFDKNDKKSGRLEHLRLQFSLWKRQKPLFSAKKNKNQLFEKKKSRAGDRTRTQKEFFVTSIPVRVFLRFLPFLACRLKVVFFNHESNTKNNLFSTRKTRARTA